MDTLKKPLPEKARRHVGRQMVFDLTGGCVVVLMFDRPSKEEWTRNCEFCGFHKALIRAVAVYDLGGGMIPNESQRKQIQASLGDPPWVAAFTSSDVFRGVMQAFRWMQGPRMAWFDPVTESKALEQHCQLSPAQIDSVVGLKGALEQAKRDALEQAKRGAK
jgi:hypothetical protein